MSLPAKPNGSGRRQSRSFKGHRRQRHYDEMIMAHGRTRDEHPLDVLIEEAPPVARLVRKARRLALAIEPQIADRKVWVAYADAQQAAHAEREARYFDAGFDHGFAAGRVSARPRRDQGAVQAFTDHMRRTALSSSLERTAVISALLHVAEALIALPTRDSRPSGRSFPRSNALRGRPLRK